MEHNFGKAILVYELSQWVEGIDPGCHNLGYDTVKSFNDDRFARALDKLYLADQATLMTEIVVKMIKKVGLAMGKVHNDSTTVKTYGKVSRKAKTGLKMTNGKSKEYRPYLKQLVFRLTIPQTGQFPYTTKHILETELMIPPI
ncbi:MAG: hypothetical protein K9H14_00655 [Actinomycetia bacterium]|nr:hypothetical protein [Actinomycetes bacterium]